MTTTHYSPVLFSISSILTLIHGPHTTRHGLQRSTSNRLEIPWQRIITAPQATRSSLWSRRGSVVAVKACFWW